MCRTRDLASLAGHDVWKAADGIKESSVGQQERQTSHSDILAAMFSKYCSAPAKQAFVKSCSLRMIMLMK